MGALKYKLEKWKKRRNIGIGIVIFVCTTIVPILLSIPSFNKIGLGTKVAILIDTCLLFAGIFVLVIAQAKLRIINKDINVSGDP